MEKVDFDGDGIISTDELFRASGSEDDHFELISFHDTDRNGKVTTKELIESWVMFAVSTHEAAQKAPRTEL
eukprot:symbB.v1.2.004263.t1/scaffold222.1/size270942/5